MKTRLIVVWALMLSCTILSTNAQEKGLFKNSPKIKANKSKSADSPEIKPKKDEFDEYEPEKPKIRYADQFEPQKELNKTVAEDTSSIDQGELSVVQQVDSIQIGDDWVQAADYYTIWDSRSINPYGLNAREFEENINLHIYDPAKGNFWNLPLNETKITSVFGFRSLGGRSRNHDGVDLDANTGDPVYSTFDGVIRVAGFDGNGYGRFVLVRHFNGLETLYGHLSKYNVEIGQMVKAGDVLGLAGSTGRSFGDHLHYENRYEGNPFSPAWIWDFTEQKIHAEHFLLTPRVWDYLRGGSAYESESEFESSVSQVKRTILHRVRRGETLDSIATKYGMSSTALADKNNLKGSNLRPGQRLKVN